MKVIYEVLDKHIVSVLVLSLIMKILCPAWPFFFLTHVVAGKLCQTAVNQAPRSPQTQSMHVLLTHLEDSNTGSLETVGISKVLSLPSS